jgi:hypothetical protein
VRRPGGRMRTPVVVGLVVVACLGIGAGRARAVPSAANSTIPSHVLLVGRRDAAADTGLGAFTVVVRDVANNPIAGATVEFRVLNCEGARLAADPLQPGVTARCTTHGFTAVTGGNGTVRMCIVGGGTIGSAPGTGPCAQVYAAGVLLGTTSVALPDLDGSRGVGINDLSLWLIDFGLSEPISRSDFDGNGNVTINDLSVWLEIWARGTSIESATSYCP